LWTLYRFFPDSAAYHVPVAYRLRGSLREDALRTALAALVNRHDVLRTRFVDDGEPYQTVESGMTVELLVQDVTDPAAAMRAAREPFDLLIRPPARFLLLRLASDDALLVLVCHHIVMDGWSTEVLIDELTTGYTAASADLSPSHRPIPISYRDFAVWQEERLTDDLISGQLDWWRDRLRDLPPPLRLPGRRDRSGPPDFAGETVPFTVPADALTALRELATAERATLFVVVLACCCAFLALPADVTDVVVGTPATRRTRPETHGVVGFFMNMLPLRADCSGDPSLRTVVRRLREWTLGAQTHADVPFERLVREFVPDRDLSVNPLAAVLVQLEGPDPVLTLPGIEPADRIANLEESSRFDVEIHVHTTATGMTGEFVHATDVFDRAAGTAMANALVDLLTRIAADPAAPLSRLCDH
jgi:hypothetical protein